MDLGERLMQLKRIAMKKIADAAMADDVGRVSSYSVLASRIEEDEHTLAAMKERIRIYEGSLGNGDKVSTFNPKALARSSKDFATTGTRQRTSRRMGRKAREDFVSAGRNRGYELVSQGNSIYRTATGKKVVLRFANEQKPDRWFLGVRDDRYDIVVLLCQQSSGGMVEFVLPREFLSEVWGSMSRSGNELKFNVARSGVNWSLLVPGRDVEPLNRFLGNHTPLKA